MKLLAILLLALTPSQERGTLTAAQERGQQIYFHGESNSSRPITATLGEGGTPFSAAIVPCANCHGEDGRGRAEAGVRPADITPQALARAATVNGRTRTPYTRAHLTRAIGMGFDSARNPLHAAMPRYAMTRDDANDLLDFLAILGTEPQPGLTDDTIRISIIGDDTLTAPDAPIYGRRIELVRDRSSDVLLTIDTTSDFLDDEVPILAVGSLRATVDQQRDALLAYAKRIGAEPVLATDCNTPGALVLMTADLASRCDIAAFPADRRVIVAAALPPNSAVLAMVTNLLAQAGRDLTRSTFIAALERHTATHPVWLMNVDAKNRRLIPVE